MITISGIFDHRTDAEQAIHRLTQELMLDRTEIQLYDGQTAYSDTHETQGFWASVKELFSSEDDRSLYSEGLRRGGYWVVAKIQDTDLSRATDILEAEGAIDLEERSASWRAEGWTPLGTTALSATSAPYMPTASVADTARLNDDAYVATDANRIPVVEEQLHVGKERREGGSVRVRSHVVETPVEASVNLHEEHVSVHRTPVDRAVRPGEGLFQDRTIEAQAYQEVAIVSKEARVVEEVVVEKTQNDRTETVHDSVRKTQVEVEDDRNLDVSRASRLG